MTDFKHIKRQYSENSLAILKQLVGAGKIEGGDYVVLNPRRSDKKAGSFRIDISSGKFHDFATGDRGGSILDLAAFVWNCDLLTAARKFQQFFPSLAGESVAAEKIPAKKKKTDPKYIWSLSKIMQHRYLDKKKISIGNAKVNIYKDRKQLIIPLTDYCPTTEAYLNIKGLQFINEDGGKSFPLPFMGLFHVASDYEAFKEVIVIAEGYATARSIAESTNFYVIAAIAN